MKKPSLKVVIIATCALIVFLIIAKRVGWIGKEKSTDVITEFSQKRTIVETVSASGKIQPELEVKISPDVSGQIVDLFVKEGDIVKKGQVLCKINPDIYVSNLQKTQAAVNSSKANLANSKAKLMQLRAAFKNVESSFIRTKKLLQENAIAQSEFESAEAAFESAKADLDAGMEIVKASEFNVQNASASEREASDNLQRTTMLAPVNGKVSKLNIELGERVVGTSQMAGTEIMRIADLNEMEVNVEVNENDIVRLKLNDTADIEVDAYMDRKFKGIVTEVANSANITGTSADQVTNFTVKIRILRDSYSNLMKGKDISYSPFRPGMSSTVDIHTKRKENVISIPIQAVTMREDTSSFGSKKDKGKDPITDAKVNEKTKDKSSMIEKEYVFLYKAGMAYLKEVETGIQDNNFIEITKGLQAGEEIIYGPYSAISKILKNKTPVNKVDKEELYVEKNDD